jgi:hypothetical protein
MSLSRSAGAWALPALVLPLASCAPAVPPAPAPTPGAPIAAVPAANGADGFDLSVANIMRGELLVGRSPSEVRWSEDSRHVYFRWRDPESGDTTTSVYRVAAAGGEPGASLGGGRTCAAPGAQGSLVGQRRASRLRARRRHLVADRGRPGVAGDRHPRARALAAPVAGREYGPLHRRKQPLRRPARRRSAPAAHGSADGEAVRERAREGHARFLEEQQHGAVRGGARPCGRRSATARPPTPRGVRFVRLPGGAHFPLLRRGFAERPLRPDHRLGSRQRHADDGAELRDGERLHRGARGAQPRWGTRRPGSAPRCST